MNSAEYQTIVIGGGPAGLAAALAAKNAGAERVLLIERERRLGGILKQCIHDGFGIIRFSEKLSGPEYAERYMDLVKDAGIEVRTETFVTGLGKAGTPFLTTVVSPAGFCEITSNTLVLATGCRERTARQAGIHGTFPAGVLTAGTAQYYVNITGNAVGKRVVILGSGDIGLIMARRLTLQGAEVAGVYEIRPEPSGLTRNVRQCLDDYGIPLHLSRTVTRIIGDKRVTAVQTMAVDGALNPIAGTEETVECDALILSVGLIPENEIADMLKLRINPRTKGACVDQNMMTSVPGAFAAGNCLFVNDLVDYVSENAARAGKAAADYKEGAREVLPVLAGAEFLHVTPDGIDPRFTGKAVFYFRAARTIKGARLIVKSEGKTVLERKYMALRPAEMERVEVEVLGGMEFTLKEEG